MKRNLAFWLAVWFGAGLVPKMPGTIGSLAAFPLWWLLRPAGPWALLVAVAVLTLVGVWAAHDVAGQTGSHDPQIVVIDEVAGQLLTLMAVADGWAWLVTAFVVFRILDQWKPWPIRRMERLSHAGWAVMLDDVMAGALGALVVGVLRT